MSKLRLTGSTSGFTELTAPAVAGSNTLTLPTGNGTAGQFLQTNGSGALSFATVATGTQWTNGSQQTLSGTAITFSSIPSNVVYIQITILDMSFNGTSNLHIRLGDAGGEESSGYVGIAYATNSVTNMPTTAYGFHGTDAAAYQYSGQVQFWNHSGNTWLSEGRIAQQTIADQMAYSGMKGLSDTLTQIRLFGSGGHSFDNGSVTLHYLTA